MLGATAAVATAEGALNAKDKENGHMAGYSVETDPGERGLAMTGARASMVRHIVTSVVSGIVVAFVTGAIGYFGFINRIDERVVRAEENIVRHEGALAETQRERADLKAAMIGVQTELRNLNRNLERLEARLIRQEDRSWDGGR